ncbi:4-hydroxythreonine-4-phosphate dehydrogenase PdxA [Stieleria varia]|uniref:4-hydroxythreonine-4-phosphate dehydrogenase n=1 Tax=Stieleria varia TaxID=2528005 RepID=A0A5C6AF66_9BACT|nr:4-hydroxythreonine-4-phosphate dehydrogenase PdxA [Stieleria varia]TWT98249.1 4-hydroxythreonine-4-phosphate dehydrogenase [Stieleria varia]
MGDCAGVGPELALTCAAIPEVTERCTPVLIGPRRILQRISEQLDLALPSSDFRSSQWDGVSAACWDVGEIECDEVTAGKFNHRTGLASFVAVDAAITETLASRLDAIVTGPIQKEAWHAANVPFIGHTELLAERTGTSDYSMMLTSDVISCVLCTIHIPLADVVGSLTRESIVRAIRLGGAALSRRLKRPARVAVLGLNPHAGENGLLSHGEEESLIGPAIEQARGEGFDIVGPLPPDTAFTPAMRDQVDVYVCMYHDQGLIPLKTLSFDDGVNVTLGLPIVRTSVDHGTAMNIAWQGKARSTSMQRAIEMAIDLVG